MKSVRFTREFSYRTESSRNEPLTMKNSTGLTVHESASLSELIHKRELVIPVPPILGIRLSLIITLKYLRRNRTQADIADDYGISQPTISRAITAITIGLADALTPFIPTVDDIPADTAHLVDGTLLPCWSWDDASELFSGKHHTAGMNVQVVSDLNGRIAWVSDPLPGRVHDVAALDAHGLLDGLDPSQLIGDKGYIGRGMTTPEREPQNHEMSESTKEYNTQINQIRWPIEQAIAHLKNWRILHTNYRRPLDTFATTITAVLGLFFLYS